MSVAISGQIIKYQDIYDAIIVYLKRFCKNIGSIRNDIPVHYNQTHRYIYSLGIKGPGTGKKKLIKPIELISSLLTLTFSTDSNRRIAEISENVVKANLDQLFLKNNFIKNNIISKYSDFLRLMLLILKFFNKKILRIYFPLTNNYAYFYDALSKESENVSYTVAPINLASNDEDSIISIINSFYTELIGTNTYNKSNNESKNLFHSILYQITYTSINVDAYKKAAIDDKNEITKLADKTLQINIT